MAKILKHLGFGKKPPAPPSVDYQYMGFGRPIRCNSESNIFAAISRVAERSGGYLDNHPELTTPRLIQEDTTSLTIGDYSDPADLRRQIEADLRAQIGAGGGRGHQRRRSDGGIYDYEDAYSTPYEEARNLNAIRNKAGHVVEPTGGGAPKPPQHANKGGSGGAPPKPPPHAKGGGAAAETKRASRSYETAFDGRPPSAASAHDGGVRPPSSGSSAAVSRSGPVLPPPDDALLGADKRRVVLVTAGANCCPQPPPHFRNSTTAAAAAPSAGIPVPVPVPPPPAAASTQTESPPLSLASSRSISVSSTSAAAAASVPVPVSGPVPPPVPAPRGVPRGDGPPTLYQNYPRDGKPPVQSPDAPPPPVKSFRGSQVPQPPADSAAGGRRVGPVLGAPVVNGRNAQDPQLDPRPKDEYDAPWDSPKDTTTSASSASEGTPPQVPSHRNTAPNAGEPSGAPGGSAASRPTLNLNLNSSPKRARQGLGLNFGCAALSVVGEPIDPNVPLQRQGWYHGSVSRQDAEQLLRAAKEGSYLVRNSESSKHDYSLSLKSVRGFIHIKIVPNADGKYILGQFSKPFDSIPDMIHHYTINKLPIKGAEHMSLLYPVIDQLL